MSDPRKPIQRPDADAQGALRNAVHQHLLKCVEVGARDTGMTGASFVLVGIGVWAAELSELDQKAVSQMFAALAVIYDPTANHTKKAHAERKRRAAVRKLFAALDLQMATPEGTA